MRVMKTRPCHCCHGTGKEIDHYATGQSLRLLRKGAGMSLREMARRMTLSAPFLSDLELGRRNWKEGAIRLYQSILTQYLTVNKRK